MTQVATLDNTTRAPVSPVWLAGGVVAVLILGFISLLTGTAHMSPWDVVTGRADFDQLQILTISRIPRTLAIVMAGSAMATAGLLMQMLVQNRFVEPSTTGVTESAGLGIMLVTLFYPAASLPIKMSVAVIFALLGTFLLMALVRSIPHRDIIVVPLLGIVLSGVIGSAALFIAWRYELQGTLQAWITGDFSGILKGRYELLWIVVAAAIVIYLFANVFTIIGLGENLSSNLGINHRRFTTIGLCIVAVVAGVTTVVAGSLPFLGLVVPNLVSLIAGDYMRRSIPLVALGGAIFVLLTDIIGRSLIAPAEIPVGVVMGIIGAAIFLVFIVKEASK